MDYEIFDGHDDQNDVDVAKGIASKALACLRLDGAENAGKMLEDVLREHRALINQEVSSRENILLALLGHRAVRFLGRIAVALTNGDAGPAVQSLAAK